MLVFWAAANSGGLSPALLHSQPALWHSWAVSGPCLQRHLDLQVEACTLLGDIGVCMGPSVVSTLPSACGLRPPPRGALSLMPRMCASPQCFGFGLDVLHIPKGVRGGRVERRLELLLQENSPNRPSVFFFLRKSSCSILLLHTRKGLSSHTAQLSSSTRDCPGQGPARPNSQLSPAWRPQSP